MTSTLRTDDPGTHVLLDSALVGRAEADIGSAGRHGDASATSRGGITMAEHLMSEGTVRGVHPEWRIREDVSWTSHAGRIVALQLSSAGASPLILDGSAAAIWEIMSDLGSANEPTIAHEVLVRFAVSREDVELPLTEFLTRLEAARLIAPEVRFTR